MSLYESVRGKVGEKGGGRVTKKGGDRIYSCRVRHGQWLIMTTITYSVGILYLVPVHASSSNL